MNDSFIILSWIYNYQFIQISTINFKTKADLKSVTEYYEWDKIISK